MTRTALTVLAVVVVLAAAANLAWSFGVLSIVGFVLLTWAAGMVVGGNAARGEPVARWLRTRWPRRGVSAR